MLNKKKSIGWIILVIVLIAGGFITYSLMNGKKPVTIKTAKVKRGTITSSISSTGILQPITTVEVKSNAGGTIIELAVDEGDYVKAGQLIAKIDPSDTLTALEQSQADYDGAVAKIDQAQKGKILQKLQTDQSIISAQQAVASAKTKLAQAQEQAKLQPQLTNNSIKQAEQGLVTAKARLAQAQETADIQPKLTASAINQAQSSLDSANSSLNQLVNSLIPQQISAAQANFNSAKVGLDNADRDLKRQQSLLDKGYVAKSTVDDAAGKFESAKAQYDIAKSKLDTIKSQTNDDLLAAKSKVQQAQSQLQNAQVNKAQDKIKLQDLESAKAAVDQAQTTLKNARDNGVQDNLKTKDVDVARTALKQAQSNLDTTIANKMQESIKSGDIIQAKSALSRAKASVTNATTQLGYTTITAPRDGVIMKKYVEVGSIVTGGKSSNIGSGSGVTIVDIADVSKMQVLANIDETDIARIAIGQDVDVTIDAYPDELFSGKVVKIAPEAIVDQSVTSVPVTVQMNIDDKRLKPTMNATCDFVIERKKDVLTVPAEAIKDDGSGGVSVSMQENGKIVSHKITIGLAGSNDVEVTSGLKEGDIVITSLIDPNVKKTTTPPGGGGRGGAPRMF